MLATCLLLLPALTCDCTEKCLWQEINTESELLTSILRGPSGGFNCFSRSAVQFIVLMNWCLLMACILPDVPSRLFGSLVRNWQKQKIINLFTLYSRHMCPAWVLQVCVHSIHNWYRSCIFTGQVGDFHHSINFISAGTQHHSVTCLTLVHSTNNGIHNWWPNFLKRGQRKGNKL